MPYFYSPEKYPATEISFFPFTVILQHCIFDCQVSGTSAWRGHAQTLPLIKRGQWKSKADPEWWFFQRYFCSSLFFCSLAGLFCFVFLLVRTLTLISLREYGSCLGSTLALVQLQPCVGYPFLVILPGHWQVFLAHCRIAGTQHGGWLQMLC